MQNIALMGSTTSEMLHLNKPSELSRETEFKLKDGIFDSSKYWDYKEYYSINELLKNVEDV